MVMLPSPRTSVIVQMSPLRTQSLPVAGRDLPVVAAGDDGVPDPGMGPVAQLDLPVLGDESRR
jgi:hypothetical protein